MAVPAHDERDLAFAKEFGLEVRSVVAPEGVASSVAGNTMKGESEDEVVAFTGKGLSINSGQVSGAVGGIRRGVIVVKRGVYIYICLHRKITSCGLWRVSGVGMQYSVLGSSFFSEGHLRCKPNSARRVAFKYYFVDGNHRLSMFAETAEIVSTWRNKHAPSPSTVG